MCLLVVAWQSHSRLPLLAAGNRDEFHARPSEAAAFWPEAGAILAGRDREAGGTWMGVSRTGRFAAVTNVREPGTGPARRSRGELPADFLAGRSTSMDYLDQVRRRAEDYAGFNLLLCDGQQLGYFSNRDPSGPHVLPPGVHALSNHLLETPWPKLLRLRHGFESALEAGRISAKTLLALLDDREPAAPDELPDTGLDPTLERRLSAPFVQGETYGTRAATLAWLFADGHGEYLERRFNPNGEAIGDSHFRFSLETDPRQ